MSGRKGMKHYPDSFKLQIQNEYNEGNSIIGMSRKYGISQWAIRCWFLLLTKAQRRNAVCGFEALGEIIAVTEAAHFCHLGNRKAWIPAEQKLSLLKPYYRQIFRYTEPCIAFKDAREMFGGNCAL